MKFIFNAFLVLLPIIVLSEAAKTMGPVGNIIINSIFDCPETEKPKGEELVVTTKLEETADGKHLDGTLESKITVDNNINYEVDLKRKEKGEWKQFYDTKGKLCRDLQQYIPKLWNKFVSAVQPAVDSKLCPLKAGGYKIEKFTAESTDIDLPAVFYGLIQIVISAKDQNGKILFCRMAEVDSQAP